MHPQIQQAEPGDCPICGMDLIPLEPDAADEAGPRVLTMSDAARALARIETTEVRRAIPEVDVRMVGKLQPDQTLERSIAARFPGRIERLFVNFEGTRVKQGEHLATVYSPELLSAQAELLQAVQGNPQGRAALAAREKLRLWGFPLAEIDAITERGSPSDTLTIYAPMGGVVTAKSVNEGEYVQTGQMLFEIADLSQLWLVLDAYESDIGWVRLGQRVQFTVEAYPGRQFDGTVSFIEPYLDETTRTISVRVNVDNSQRLLKPGMLARGLVHPRVGPHGEVYAEHLAGKFISPMHPWIVKDEPGQCDVCGMDLVPAAELGYEPEPLDGEPPLLVPASAVLRTGKRAVVYVEVPGRDKPTYDGREIVLGPRTAEGFVVLGGLHPGERVVTQGAFKIDSSLQIMARPSMMTPVGDPPEAAHDHAAHGAETDAPGHGAMPEDAPISDAVAGLEDPIDHMDAKAVLAAYLDLQSALAGDDLAAARAAARSIQEETGHYAALADLTQAMVAAETLEGIRRPHFETLSQFLIRSVEQHPDYFPQLLRMHCPMVYDDRGADWLQASEPLLNPYFGAQMMHCGVVKGALGGGASE